MRGQVTLTSMDMPTVTRGSVLQLHDGQLYVVKRQRGSELEVVPFRWWHRIRWTVAVFGFALGFLLSQLLRFV